MFRSSGLGIVIPALQVENASAEPSAKPPSTVPWSLAGGCELVWFGTQHGLWREEVFVARHRMHTGCTALQLPSHTPNPLNLNCPDP